ncbi:hypothetical protein J7399_19595 [Shimia sp. R9_1]|uniref:hypothetical protein n=1 Tax=Shimia sp. R9_1 TaxID=2821111 RepID=UPI001ADA9EC4|nr:hypothetical protein [Shimia sp. R9_1]MBO9409651.1 hypothetical protein [Shimia sp. R9_1]
MSDEQCRMVTKSGVRCSRAASSGSLGFCWQHTPSNRANAEIGKNRLEGAALAVAASEVLLKIVELAVTHLHELFGSPPKDQSAAKTALISRIDLGPQFPELPEEYSPGSRVDWVRLNEIVQNMDRAVNEKGRGVAHVESDFGRGWTK